MTHVLETFAEIRKRITAPADPKGGVEALRLHIFDAHQATIIAALLTIAVVLKEGRTDDRSA